MGLDNGICVKRTAVTEKIPEMALFEDDWIREQKTDYEVCYWRKCWNVRCIILDVVSNRFFDSYRILLTVADVDRIAEALGTLNDENWEDEGSSIWEFDEMKDNLETQISNLGVLKRLMQEHELEVYFYDSY